MYGKIKELKRKGFNKSQVSRKLGKDYKTILKYWEMTVEEYSAEKEYASTRIYKAEPYEDYVVENLRKYPDMSAAQLYDWIMEKQNEKQLPFKARAFRSFVAEIRLKYVIPKPTRIRQYQAVDDPPMGDQSQVDMGEITLNTYNGKRKKVYCFAIVLSHSRYKYVYWQEMPFTTETFVMCHQLAFKYFGGRTREIVYDQDKILAVSENHGDIIYTEGFQAYISECKFDIYLCRGADPESKGRIESVVGYAKHGFAEHRTLHDIDSFNDDCLDWLDRTGNGKTHGTTKKVPAKVFSIEKQYLKPVQELKFNYATNTIIPYAVRKDNIILYKSNRYRVPKGTYQPGKNVYMIVDDGEVNIIDVLTGEIYATHPLCHDRGRLIGQIRKNRDMSLSIEALESRTVKLLGRNKAAILFLETIHKLKPRYYRDQLGAIKTVCNEKCNSALINQALNYCIERELYSASNFKSAVIYLDEVNHSSTSELLPGLPAKYRNMLPEIRKLAVYEEAMNNGEYNG